MMTVMPVRDIPPTAPPASSPHILLIDDEPEGLRALVALLRQQNWQVSVMSEPQRALLRALAMSGAPDLIVLDMSMPGMDGIALLRHLREAPQTQHVPVIFLSAANQSKQRLAALTLGGVDYVTKPYEPQEVLARIRIHLRLAQRGSEPADALDVPGVQASDADEVLLRAAMHFIEEHLADLPSLDELATALGTHEKRLSQVFRQRTSSTVFAFARAMRLQKGKELLASSEMDVRDIAELLGYQSAASFTTAFREQQGVTPSEFRQQARRPAPRPSS